MGKRGPKSVDMGILTSWEFKFCKAFHLLRDGMPFAARHMPPPPGLNQPELRGFIDRLKRMSPEEYCLVSRRVERELGGKVNLRRPPVWTERLWAEQERTEEVFWLERALKPPKIEVQAERRKIWDDLVEANTHAALRKACGRWAQLSDVRGKGMQEYPSQILASAGAFFSMKSNKRFPRSDYADDARLEYLARGMAGVSMGKSPMTAIERLRNMKHGPSGPLWDTHEHYCKCWRCSLRRSNEITGKTQTWYENGLRLFMELAETSIKSRQ